MATIIIESLGGKEITLKPYTRAIARAINEKLLEGVVVRDGIAGQQTDIPAINASRAEELSVKLISGLSQEEMDAITQNEYNTLKEAVNEATSGKKKE